MVEQRHRSKAAPRQPTPEAMLTAWERTFRSDFERDAGAQFTPLLQRFYLKVDVQEMLEGTIDFVTACVALLGLDGVAIRDFLADQRYDGSAPNATYALTFDMGARSAARVLVTPRFKGVDLADLYDWPWWRIERAGYGDFWITRLDDLDLSHSELEALEKVVTKDLRFDYVEEEVSFFFDAEQYERALTVVVYDTPEEFLNDADSPGDD
jgi:hypothetical protein